MPKAPNRSGVLRPSAKKGRISARLAADVTTCFVATKDDSERQEIRFGGVIVEATAPPDNVAKRNINEGRSALARAQKVLARPGVDMRLDAKIPLYRADPTKPGLLIRTMNGRNTPGRIVGGKFKPT